MNNKFFKNFGIGLLIVGIILILTAIITIVTTGNFSFITLLVFGVIALSVGVSVIKSYIDEEAKNDYNKKLKAESDREREEIKRYLQNKNANNVPSSNNFNSSGKNVFDNHTDNYPPAKLNEEFAKNNYPNDYTYPQSQEFKKTQITLSNNSKKDDYYTPNYNTTSKFENPSYSNITSEKQDSKISIGISNSSEMEDIENEVKKISQFKEISIDDLVIDNSELLNTDRFTIMNSQDSSLSADYIYVPHEKEKHKEEKCCTDYAPNDKDPSRESKVRIISYEDKDAVSHQQKRCPRCRRKNEWDASFCRHCGRNF